jgi:hypothetical protein
VRLRLALLAGAILASAGCCTAGAPMGSNAQGDILKNWALSRCLSKVSSGATADDAAKSAAAYLEMGKVGADVYDRLDALTASYLARTYGGSVNGRYDTMKCIDLYNSRDLDKLVQSAH